MDWSGRGRAVNPKLGDAKVVAAKGYKGCVAGGCPASAPALRSSNCFDEDVVLQWLSYRDASRGIGCGNRRADSLPAGRDPYRAITNSKRSARELQESSKSASKFLSWPAAVGHAMRERLTAQNRS